MKSDIEKAVELKNRHIAKFQDSKERSMAIMSSGRDATLMVAQIIQLDDSDDLENKWSDEEIEKELKKWRKFFFYEIYGTDPDDEIKQHLKETLPPKQYLGF